MASTLVRYVIGGETWLRDFGGLAISYLSDIQFEQIYYGDTTECILGMIFFTWCIVKLYFYFTSYRACFIIIVYNDIIHMGRKMI